MMMILKLTIYCLRAASILSILYFSLIIFISGIKTSFLWFWLMLSLGSGILSLMLPLCLDSSLPFLPAATKIFIFLLWELIIIFLLAQIKLFTFSRQVPPENVDFCIVLGAQVRGDIPSKTLNMRINAAYEYLNKNPDTKVICSGGKGEGENISEAEAISKRLMELGISKDRILLEENSTNTTQNLQFSGGFLDKEKASVVIITSDFHLYRACKIAEKQGFDKVYGLAAKELLITTPGYFVREFMAICKDFLFGNL